MTDRQQMHASGEEPEELAEMASDLPGLFALPPDAIERALELHTLELRQAEAEAIENATTADRPAGQRTRWCPDCGTVQPVEGFALRDSQRVGVCEECQKLRKRITDTGETAPQALASMLDAREQITMHAGLASAAETMIALTRDAGGPAGLARWLRYRVERAEACGDLRSVVRLMAIVGAIAGLRATITPTEMATRIKGVRAGDKQRRKRARKKPGSATKAPPGKDSSD